MPASFTPLAPVRSIRDGTGKQNMIPVRKKKFNFCNKRLPCATYIENKRS
jgi:hypothetical protein